MAKERFEVKNFKIATRTVIQQANTIINEYLAMGYKLTLRQLYYQFVARDIIPNKQSEYKNLGKVINDARKTGHIDWDAIEDRTRNVEFISSWSSPEDIIASAAASYKENLWRNQPCYVEGWVEKEALIGVIEPICRELRIPFFACRGYVSQSESYAAGKRFAKMERAGKRVVILHLGDHDPSGLDMTRDNGARARMFARSPRVEVRRLALNMDQIEEYGPPPNPAKDSDIRFRGYQAQYGDESWELDSLDPPVITGLISAAVAELIDREQWDKDEAAETENLESLQTASMNWTNVARYLKYRSEDLEDADEE